MLDRVHAGLTPGQRWTSALAANLTGVVLLFGAPAATDAPSPGVSTHTPGPSATEGEVVQPQNPAQAEKDDPESSGHDIGGDKFASPIEIHDLSEAETATPSESADAPPNVLDDDLGLTEPQGPLSNPPSIIALVPTGSAELPGRDEETIANHYLQPSRLDATVVTHDPEEDDPLEVCQRATSSGDVIIAGTAITNELRHCLLNAGTTLLGFDSAGNQVRDDGRLISTRRGIGANLVDIGRWAMSTGALTGSVGVAAADDLQVQVDPAIELLSRLGIEVTSVAYVDHAQSFSDISEGARQFATEGVDITVFALPVDQQRRWVEQSSVLTPAMEFVVADAFDAVMEETYPTGFDGATAYTSVRGPWFKRAHEETLAQQRCREAWEGEAVPPTTLGGAEILKTMMWCQHVELAESAARAVTVDGADFTEAILAESYESPLTSTLKPLEGEEDYGPFQDAVLTWRADCTCWEESTSYHDRKELARER